MPSDSDSERIGLLAGWGQFPILVAQSIRQQGHQVFCLGVKNHANPALADICNDFRTTGIAKVGAQIRYFRRHGVRKATIAGKIFKRLILLHGLGFVAHLPDWRGLRAGWSSFISNTTDRNDDTISLALVNAYAEGGVEIIPPTDFAPSMLVDERLLTKRHPTGFEEMDIEYGWQLAKELGRLDVGQSVIVKNRMPIALEAVEGTDECIRRAGQLCPQGGFTVVKVAKPQQDMRFDVPTIGRKTLETLVESGGRVLAVEADKTIVLDEPDVIEFANRHRLTIVSVRGGQAAATQAAA